MAKTPAEIRSLARAQCPKAIRVLKGIMCSETAPEAARIAAANSLLDRGYGKATQPIAGEDGEPIRVLSKIVREIVPASGGDPA